jgi:6-phosphogluconolactonase
MPTEPGSERAAVAYEDRLKSIAPSRADGMPVLDLVVLGLGKDGHTASLFPQDPALMEDTRQVLSVRGGMPYVYRFTLTLPVLNSARHVFFLVSGANKAPIVKQILTTDSSPFLPAQQVQPTDGKIIWLLDRAAASHL